MPWSLMDWKRTRRRDKTVAELRDAWGKPVRRERDWDLHSIVSGTRKADGNAQFLDDQTWKDLNLALVFAEFDRTFSLPGEVELYRMLRAPATETAVLNKRDRIITLFQTDATARERVQLELSELGRTRYAYGLVELLWGALPPRSRLVSLYSLLTILVVAWLLVIIGMAAFGLRWGPFALTSFTVLFTLNLFIHYRTRRRLNVLVLSIRYLSKMIQTARALARSGIAGLEDVSQKLEQCWAAAKAIPKATASLVPERGGAAEFADICQEYLAILFLTEVRSFYAVIEEIRKCREMLATMFETLGQLDSLQAVASVRKGLRRYAKPEFQADGLMLEVGDAFHPLLLSPVPNSISLAGTSCLITGSNMSGKSTFLRTLGLNAVLAQSVFTCPAASYKGSLFRVISSLSQTDDLMEGKSQYLVEAERLLAMIRSSEGATPTLCIIDEVLCGTNSRERLAASEEILQYLAKGNAIVVTATHDVELVDRLAQSYTSYHFSDYVDDNGLHFDYLLRPGKATTTNAIRLLEYLSYPGEIVDSARTKAFGSRGGETPPPPDHLRTA